MGSKISFNVQTRNDTLGVQQEFPLSAPEPIRQTNKIIPGLLQTLQSPSITARTVVV